MTDMLLWVGGGFQSMLTKEYTITCSVYPKNYKQNTGKGTYFLNVTSVCSARPEDEEDVDSNAADDDGSDDRVDREERQEVSEDVTEVYGVDPWDGEP